MNPTLMLQIIGAKIPVPVPESAVRLTPHLCVPQVVLLNNYWFTRQRMKWELILSGHCDRSAGLEVWWQMGTETAIHFTASR